MKRIMQLRQKVDRIDKQMVALLAERMELVRKIAREKQKAEFPLLDDEREEQLKEMWKEKAMERGLLTTSVSHILSEILTMSKKEQQRMSERDE